MCYTMMKDGTVENGKKAFPWLTNGLKIGLGSVLNSISGQKCTTMQYGLLHFKHFGGKISDSVH